jgi:hypothetical protein
MREDRAVWRVGLQLVVPRRHLDLRRRYLDQAGSAVVASSASSSASNTRFESFLRAIGKRLRIPAMTALDSYRQNAKGTELVLSNIAPYPSITLVNIVRFGMFFLTRTEVFA